MGWYGILKVVHVLSVVVWIGGATALAAVTARLIRARDRATLAALLPHSIMTSVIVVMVLKPV